jgi:2',3'-cyclic-nucleotide 2'-phosphodiesterase / 3'-nucleotidase
MTSSGEQVSLTILYTSDVHGNVLPLRYADNQPMDLGLAKIATLIQDFRHRSENVLLIDNGDVIQGTPLTYHHARITPDLPNPIVQVMNELTYDAAVFGNHEFNYGSQILQRVVHESKFPWLSANIVKTGTDIPYFGTPYLVRTLKSGVRVAVLGLTTQYIPNWENPAHIEEMDFLDAVDTCQRWVAKIRRESGPDVMVVAYHGGFERDLDTGQLTERYTGENQGYRLCSEVKGIDVLLTGHQHRALSGTVCGVTVIQPGCNAAWLGKVDVLLERTGKKWNIVSTSAELVDVAGTAPDPKVVEVIRPYEEQTQVWLDQPIGRILGDMTVKDPMALRLRDNPLIEFVNKVQMETAGVSISNAALFDNQCPGFPEDVTVRDVVANYIYPNTLRILRVKGQDIKDALERSAAYFAPYDGSDIQVNPAFTAPKPQHYNYDMWEGIEYKINISRPLGARVVELLYEGQPLDMEADYDVVMNNYRAAGGGDYEMYKGKPVVQDIPTEVPELIVSYIMERKIIPATVNHNWEVIHDEKSFT